MHPSTTDDLILAAVDALATDIHQIRGTVEQEVTALSLDVERLHRVVVVQGIGLVVLLGLLLASWGRL